MEIRWLTVFLDVPADDAAVVERFWPAVTGASLSARRGPDGEFATLVPREGDAYLRVQRVRDGGGGCHLDLHVDDPAAGADRAVALGAVERFRDDRLVVLDSPGGFAFCFVGWHGEATVPPPGPARLDQLCLDAPAAAFDAECAFWAALTGWDLGAGALPEFRYLERPAGIAVRLLLQRRAVSGDGDRVTAHVDFACTDRTGVTARHIEAGAVVAGSGPRWTTLRDPSGRLYCLTDRDPRTGRLP
ncbi:VOC family protein [Dactylosporangium matsuzakiense]|uniref:VOC family protein n=1 Tax=Dactylosporangium matsuzakiense TaxID=53360 RepID=UPI0021C2D926|nr:VOC family protein [Dactylosporangium matsuzakiense]UWZ48251.1 hypothetical protein Dmats_18695 [Dactylosporangium matsuzakiense]